jgi:broad specificity phosphatase PhoE
MKVIFTRHGETKENAAGLSMGQGLNGSLNEAGIEQAQRLALRLKDEKFQYVYVSDLARAVDTAKEIVKFHPAAQFITTPALRERNLGIYEGGSRELWKKALKESPVPFHAFKPAKGDSYEELQARVAAFWKELTIRHANDTLLLVSHGAALATLFLHIFERPLTPEEYERHKPDNTALTVCEFSPEGACTTHIFNSTEHLEVEQITQA